MLDKKAHHNMGESDVESVAPEAQTRTWRRRIMIWLIILGVLLVAWVLVIWFAQRVILYPNYIVTVPATPQPPLGAQVLWLETPAGPVEAWFVAAPDASAASPGPAVIFAHGNGEVIDDWPDLLEGYRDLGISVLLPEYRGYGRSAGRPSQQAIVADFVQWYDTLAARDDVDDQRIIFHGRSLGGGVVAALAEHRKPAALILQSSFTSTGAMATRMLVPRILMRDPYDVLAVVRDFKGPVLVMHGKFDEIVPLAHGQELAAAAADGTIVLYDVDHNVLPPMDVYWPAIEAFLRESGVLPPE